MALTKFIVLLFVCSVSILINYEVSLSATTPSGGVENDEAFDSRSSEGYGVDCGKPNTVKNMPVVHSIDGLPICGAQAALTLLLQNNCKQSNSNCMDLNPDTTPSVLSLAAIGDEGIVAAKMKPPGPVELKRNNPLSIDDLNNAEFILNQVSNASAVLAEACYPFDQFTSKYKGSVTQIADASRAEFVALQKNYKKMKDFESKGVCVECLNEMLLKLDGAFMLLDRIKSIQDIQDAIKANENFDQFLHRILLGGCRKPLAISVPAFSLWPPNKSASNVPTYLKTLAQIVKVLSTNTPLTLDFCTDHIPVNGSLKNCSGHALVVSGYKRVCKTTIECSKKDDAIAKPDCKDLLQVHNSWGVDWQKRNNDGWLDAKVLLKHADVGHTSQMLYFISSGLD